MIDAKIDTTRFESDFRLYAKETSKTLVDAINYKLFDAARASIKGTDKADAKKVKASLEQMSFGYRGRTVGQMIVIKQSHLKNRRVFESMTSSAV